MSGGLISNQMQIVVIVVMRTWTWVSVEGILGSVTVLHSTGVLTFPANS